MHGAYVTLNRSTLVYFYYLTLKITYIKKYMLFNILILNYT